jgi:hypothetical protein
VQSDGLCVLFDSSLTLQDNEFHVLAAFPGLERMRSEAKVLVASTLMKGRTSAILSSGKNFNPVAGLFLMQIMSLGAAISPMYKKIPGIQKYLAVVYDWAREFAKSHPALNIEAIAAIHMYTFEDTSDTAAI